MAYWTFSGSQSAAAQPPVEAPAAIAPVGDSIPAPGLLTAAEPAAALPQDEPARREPELDPIDVPRRPEPTPAPRPTRPAETPLAFDANLGTILFGSERRLAIVDGRIVGEGDEVRGARVVEISQNAVLLRDAQGRQAVLKIANAREEYALLEAQNGALRHVAEYETEHAGTALCPQPLRTPDGSTIAAVTGPDGRKHWVRLLSYIDGKPLALVKPHDAGLLADLGGFMGRLDRALAGYDHPALRRIFHWDVAQAADVIGEYKDEIADPQRAATTRRPTVRLTEPLAKGRPRPHALPPPEHVPGPGSSDQDPLHVGDRRQPVAFAGEDPASGNGSSIGSGIGRVAPPRAFRDDGFVEHVRKRLPA